MTTATIQFDLLEIYATARTTRIVQHKEQAPKNIYAMP
jgi:hypothetical protein